MFTFDTRFLVARLIGALALALLGGAACDAPPVLVPPEDRSLALLMILDPDTTSQPALMLPVAPEGVVTEPAGVLYGQGRAVASVAGPRDKPSNELHPCHARYASLIGTGGQYRCLEFEHRPQFGAVYRVRISAEGRPTATATTMVPGDFRVLEVRAAGDPPGTRGLRVRWTRSEGAYRYLVGLRATTPPRRHDRQGWYVATQDTVLDTVVSGPGAEALEGGGGAWYVDVYAVDKAVYEHLTTGSSSELFPAPPVQNVEGGYGAVGAWVRRTKRIEVP